MARRKNSRASEREQNDRRMTMQQGDESLISGNGMEADRAERLRSAGAHGDALAGDEGVDDPAMSAAHRDDMTETPMHGDALREGLESEESEPGQRMKSQRSRRTNQRANDERFDEASEFSGRGGQKEGSHTPGSKQEGTGYTEDK